jgi:VanZ family protein
VTRTVLAVFWLLVLAVLTLMPRPTDFQDPTAPQLSACVICGERGTADAILNVLLFVPLGLVLSDRRWRLLRVVGAGLLLSASIEFTQHFIPGRYSNLGDVVWNTSGAWVGALIWSWRAHWLPGTGREVARLRNAAVAAAAVATFAFGWLMEPSLPNVPYWGQWTPDLGFMPAYDGRVVRAQLDTMRIPPGRFPRRHDPRKLLMGNWRIDVTFVKGTPPTSLSPILNIYDEKHREVDLLGAEGQDFVFRERSRALFLRLDQPDLRLEGAMAAAVAGDTVRAAVVRRGPDRCLTFQATSACPAFTPGRAWSLLMYPELGSGVRRTLDALWMLVLMLPVGFWSRDLRRLAAAGVTTGLTIGIAVALTRLVWPTWTEIGGAVIGLTAGHVLRLLVAAHPRFFLWRGSPVGLSWNEE